MLRPRLSTICLIICLSVAVTSSAATATLPDACAAPRLLLPDSAERQTEGLVGEIHCYRLDLIAAGVWHLSITTPAPAASRARFEILDVDGRRASVESFERSAAERLTFVTPGIWLVRVSSEDPRRPLPAYRLASRFVESDRGEMTWKSEEDGELEIESEGLVAGGGDRTAQIRQALCRETGADDHGDTLACATTIRCRTHGELANGWGDDVDAFRFRVDRWQTIEIATSGDLGTHGELSGSDGQRLETAGGTGGDFRLVRTLGPGTYFVKVSGDVAGGYGLEIRTLRSTRSSTSWLIATASTARWSCTGISAGG